MEWILSLRKEIVATAAFAIAGVVGLALTRGEMSAVLANALFYAALVLNTYFSVRFFGSLPPKGRDERIIDGVLVVTYIALALSIGWVIAFTLASVALFAAATMKYILLLPIMERRDIVRRKLLIDALGLAFCTVCFVGAWAGYPLASAWTLAIVFNVASVYLLFVRPMYVA